MQKSFFSYNITRKNWYETHVVCSVLCRDKTSIKKEKKRSKINVSKFIYLYNIALCVRMWTLICLSYLEIVATMYEHNKKKIHFHFIPECETVRKGGIRSE